MVLEPPPAGELKQKFAEFSLLLNKQLKPLGFELCRARMEDAEEHWYAIVNRTPDAAGKVGSKFNAQELEFFNKLVSGRALSRVEIQQYNICGGKISELS